MSYRLDDTCAVFIIQVPGATPMPLLTSTQALDPPYYLRLDFSFLCSFPIFAQMRNPSDGRENMFFLDARRLDVVVNIKAKFPTLYNIPSSVFSLLFIFSTAPLCSLAASTACICTPSLYPLFAVLLEPFFIVSLNDIISRG